MWIIAVQQIICRICVLNPDWNYEEVKELIGILKDLLGLDPPPQKKDP